MSTQSDSIDEIKTYFFDGEIDRSKARQESDMLKSYLKKAQDDIIGLLDEKRKLLDTVRNLQVSIS